MSKVTSYKIDFSNKVFDNTKVIRYSHSHRGRAVWMCECCCGKIHYAHSDDLKKNKINSCGCRGRNYAMAGSIKKYVNTPEHNAWRGAIYRCCNPNNKEYFNYGGRGISICDRWRTSFLSFLSDMGKIPGRGYSLDRINNNGNYEPGNCRWATGSEQQNNRRTSIIVDYNGKKQSVSNWCRELNIVSQNSAHYRIRHGWSPVKAITTPKNIYNRWNKSPIIKELEKLKR